MVRDPQPAWRVLPWQVEEVILANLERLAGEGFTQTAIEAAINTIEFSLRENNTGSFPRGLSLMLRAMASWIYDRDPLQPLHWTRDLAHFKVPSAARRLPYMHAHACASYMPASLHACTCICTCQVPCMHAHACSHRPCWLAQELP